MRQKCYAWSFVVRAPLDGLIVFGDHRFEYRLYCIGGHCPEYLQEY